MTRNRLSNLKTTRNYFVSLNPSFVVDPSKILNEFGYSHPIYDVDSLCTQKELIKLNGKGRTFFCGSYFGYGFHEDAVRSACDLVSSLKKYAKRSH